MSAAFAPELWSDFFVAQLGAAAALTGLVIVAISINLKEIVGQPLLASRAAETVMMLASVLVAATLGLVPRQPVPLLGLELVLTGLLFSLMMILNLRSAWRIRHKDERRALRVLLDFGATLPLMAAGISLMAGSGGGLYWMAPAVLVSMAGGLLNTWVLLVEILR